MSVAVPALADVKAGVDAWARGDYTTAVREWRGPANAGDPDAQFNMAQAYRLGRGVEENAAQAEVLYAKAAAQGHIKASDNYGLLLFQAGRREEAMPYVKGAADRGDPRAQYLLGIAHFNGELVEKDWVRAYALLTLANGSGLPQAPPALAQMDDFIPLEQRQQAQLVAQNIKRNADTQRAQQLAAVDLAITDNLPDQARSRPAPTAAPNTAQTAAQTATPTTTPLPQAVRRLPQPIPAAVVPPSVAAARAAVAEAARVTGTESPATAGADFLRQPIATGTSSAPIQAAQTRPVEAARPAPAAAAAPTTRSTSSADGPWRVQLGAFSVSANADRLWSRVAGNSALAGKKKFVVPSGRVVRLQAGGFASRNAAQMACNSLKRSGQDCLVTR